jgi:hypothetical protein
MAHRGVGSTIREHLVRIGAVDVGRIGWRRGQPHGVAE